MPVPGQAVWFGEGLSQCLRDQLLETPEPALNVALCIMLRRFSTIGLSLLLLVLSLLPLALLGGSLSSSWQRGRGGHVECVWGRRGVSEGRFLKPRAIALSDQNEIYVVDMTARIQVFDTNGTFHRQWRTPLWERGKPTGLSFDNDGNLMVADTHYYRVLFYSPTGELLVEKTIGGTAGHGPGQFGLVTDAVQDSKGNYYVAEYGEYDRIQKLTPTGRVLFEWGGQGVAEGQFSRPQNLAIDADDRIWVADACNHRIQVFDATGDKAKLVLCFGHEGTEPGEFRYPYDLWLDGNGHLFVCEFGNDRVQKFTTEGEFLDGWSGGGRNEGLTSSPWALIQDQNGKLHVLDTYNHRVQRVEL